MAKGFGIAALVCAILAIFIPFVGIVVSGIAIVLAIVAALSGDRVFATATSLIAAVNTFFLSPSVMLVLHTSPAAPVIEDVSISLRGDPDRGGCRQKYP